MQMIINAEEAPWRTMEDQLRPSNTLQLHKLLKLSNAWHRSHAFLIYQKSSAMPRCFSAHAYLQRYPLHDVETVLVRFNRLESSLRVVVETV